MRKQKKGRSEKGAIDIVEESVYLLKTAGLSNLACHFIGTVPFVVGLLYFWVEMSRGAFAYRYVTSASLGLALLFVWMKVWQSFFAAMLRDRLGCVEGRGDRVGISETIIGQAILQPLALLALPLAALFVLPFPWVWAFFHSVTAFGATCRRSDLPKRAARLAGFRPMQNNMVLAIVSGFALFVLIDCFALIQMGPFLVKYLLGIETRFTLSSAHLMNTTLVFSAWALCYLFVSPLWCAVYVVRGFYGESVTTGEDILADFRQTVAGRLRRGAPAVVLLILLSVCPAIAKPIPQQPGEPVMAGGQEVSAVDIEKAVGDVMTDPRYSWRMPREVPPETVRKGIVSAFLENLGNDLDRLWNWWVDRIEPLMEKFRNWLKRDDDNSKQGEVHAPSFDFDLPFMALNVLVPCVLGITLCVLAVVLYRLRHAWRGLRRKPVQAGSVAGTPDLNDDDTTADELPGDAWLRMARDLLESGEIRLAIRAMYMACLAHLADAGVITIARHKSNRDYRRELERKAHDDPRMLKTFSVNVAVLERVWYGRHSVLPAHADDFMERVEIVLKYGNDN